MRDETTGPAADRMEIGWPTNVRHVAHVTFDRFNGFLGLPSEFEPEVPRKAPSASATVFGVSTESMQLSYDSRGNCIPVVLLLMQGRLYSQGGLQAEGIFRITAENSEEEYVREQLNRGVIPDGIDVHCLAGLIKAWFRELPNGILDPLSPEKLMQCETEQDFIELMRLLPPTQASLLNWAVNLMADVVQHEHLNKMNSRNIALVFAPNMSQMADPLTALMYAVQVMNFLKTLIEKTLREREATSSRVNPSDESEPQSPAISCVEDSDEDSEEEDGNDEEANRVSCEEEEYDEVEQVGFSEEDDEETEKQAFTGELAMKEEVRNATSTEKQNVDTDRSSTGDPRKIEIGESSSSSKNNVPKPKKSHLQPPELPVPAISNLNRICSRAERGDAWR